MSIVRRLSSAASKSPPPSALSFVCRLIGALCVLAGAAVAAPAQAPAQAPADGGRPVELWVGPRSVIVGGSAQAIGTKPAGDDRPVQLWVGNHLTYWVPPSGPNPASPRPAPGETDRADAPTVQAGPLVAAPPPLPNRTQAALPETGPAGVGRLLPPLPPLPPLMPKTADMPPLPSDSVAAKPPPAVIAERTHPAVPSTGSSGAIAPKAAQPKAPNATPTPPPVPPLPPPTVAAPTAPPCLVREAPPPAAVPASPATEGVVIPQEPRDGSPTPTVPTTATVSAPFIGTLGLLAAAAASAGYFLYLRRRQRRLSNVRDEPVNLPAQRPAVALPAVAPPAVAPPVVARLQRPLPEPAGDVVPPVVAPPAVAPPALLPNSPQKQDGEDEQPPKLSRLPLAGIRKQSPPPAVAPLAVAPPPAAEPPARAVGGLPHEKFMFGPENLFHLQAADVEEEQLEAEASPLAEEAVSRQVFEENLALRRRLGKAPRPPPDAARPAIHLPPVQGKGRTWTTTSFSSAWTWAPSKRRWPPRPARAK